MDGLSLLAQGYQTSFRAQRDRGIDAGRAPRGHVAGGQGDQRPASAATISSVAGSPGRHAEEHAGDDPPQGESAAEADGDAERG